MDAPTAAATRLARRVRLSEAADARIVSSGACRRPMVSASDVVPSSVKLATAAARHTWNSVFGPSEVARLANAQVHQARDAVLHHLSAPTCLGERRTDL